MVGKLGAVWVLAVREGLGAWGGFKWFDQV